MDKKFVSEFVKAAANYGEVTYRYRESLELVKSEKSNLENLRRWAKKPEGRRVTGHAKRLKMEISETRERLETEMALAKTLALRVARLKRAIAIKTRQLLAD